jgi:peptidoglycan hydrolase-like protein with peptidoglycan-binding domain
MRTRSTIAAITAALAVTLVGCASSDDDSKPTATKSSSEPSADVSAAEKAAGIPPEPDAATRAALIQVLKAINPALVTDEDKTIDNSRNQCATINGGGKADQSAKARFSTSDHEVTNAEAQAINAALKASLCS